MCWKHINPHLRCAVLRRSHPCSPLESVTELFIYLKTGVRRRSCGTNTHITTSAREQYKNWIKRVLKCKDQERSDYSNCCRAIVLDSVLVILPTSCLCCKLKHVESSLTQGEDLPQQNAEGPNVTLGGEHLVKDGLWRHPFKGEAGLSANQITGVRLQMPTHEETFKVIAFCCLFGNYFHFVHNCPVSTTNNKSYYHRSFSEYF